MASLVIGRAARDLPPGAFSLVMATGIVSTAAQMLGWETLSWALFGLNLLFYLVLVGLLSLRLLRFRDRIRDDFTSHARSAGFFTTVAGTGVLGSELLLRVHAPEAAWALWWLALVLWVGLIYGFFGVLTALPEKPPLHEGLNASWMLLVVSTQSVSLLGTMLSPTLGGAAEPLLGFTTGMFLLGCMFYFLLFSLILYRFLFFPLTAVGMSPPYWINMGAVAITTVAGSLLMLRAPDSPLLLDLLPFLKGFTLLFWATATWWFPLLLALGAWRHLLHRVPIEYDVQYWSMVFPLGMYTVATLRLSEAIGWDFLAPLPSLIGPVAVLAWVLAFVGLARRTYAGISRPSAS